MELPMKSVQVQDTLTKPIQDGGTKSVQNAMFKMLHTWLAGGGVGVHCEAAGEEVGGPCGIEIGAGIEDDGPCGQDKSPLWKDNHG